MRIIDNRRLPRFVDIPTGTVFSIGEDYFVKTDDPVKTSLLLSTGKLFSHTSSTPVTPLNVALQVED